MAASAALHPPTFDPADPLAPLGAVRGAPGRWIAVHAGFGLGLAAWTLGLVAVARRTAAARPGGWAASAPPLLAAALALWLGVMAFEAAGLPSLPPGPPPAALHALWPAALAGGYAAALLQWAAALALAADLAGAPGTPGLLGRAGYPLLAPVPAGLAAAWLWPERAVPILLLTAGPAAAWSLALGWAAGDR